MGFFYKHKPRGFNYIPRYYDPQKEEWEKKKAEAGMDSSLSHEEQLRLEMRRKWGTQKDEDNSADRRYKTIRAVIIGAVVLVAFYYIFCTPMFTRIVEGLMGQ
ncbi:MAG: hypothetical protein K5920_05370 [Bacteroidales bacterium]|nr:hypothetical protein [Bacteroidales bacterium]